MITITEIFMWLSNQISTQWIAIITAIAGFLVWKSDHAKLIVEPDKVAHSVAGILLDDGRSLINQEHSMQHLVMWMINSSANDISFFDLRVVLDTGEADYYTPIKFSNANDLKKVSAEGLIPIKDGLVSNGLIAVSLPQANYGTVPAHGFVQLDLVFHADKISDNNMVVMKLAQSHNLWSRFRHSRIAPRWLRPKMGYSFSETKEVALSFQVKELDKLNRLD